jgi:cupin fold WbuC family metalloprotein
VRLKQFNEEVLFADNKIVRVGRQEVDLLKERARGNQRHRMRLCAHRSLDDKVHEMFIAIQKGAYVRPHKHLDKSESFHIIEGSIDVIIFDESGSIAEIFRLGEHSSGVPFYHRISDPLYHTLLVRSDFVVFQETANGPFQRCDTVYAPWAPEEDDVAAATEYMRGLAHAAEAALRTCKPHPAGWEKG